MKLISTVLFTVTVLFSITSQANTLSTSISTCAKISNDSNRLTCFDQLVKVNRVILPSVTDKKIVSTKPKKKTDKNEIIENFGSNHLKQQVFKSSEEKTIALKVLSVKKDAYKKLRLTFENGQIWKQTNNEYFRIKSGDQAIFTEGALGAIYLKKSGKNRSIRVKRVK